MSFRAPKSPPPPPPPAPLPTETAPDVRQKAQDELAKAAARRGRSSTIMSGQLGDVAPVQVQRKSLLGGA